MPLRLLIADDRPRTRRAVQALLAASLGFQVVGEASDGEEALARVEELQPDLVLLDVRMPRLDGVAATARIKTRWPSIRVVVHSLATECRDAALAAGADAFVAKGGRPEELLTALGAELSWPRRPAWPLRGTDAPNRRRPSPPQQLPPRT